MTYYVLVEVEADAATARDARNAATSALDMALPVLTYSVVHVVPKENGP